MEVGRPLSRRAFLRVCALGAGSAAIAAGCGGTEEAEPTATPTQTPTRAPATPTVPAPTPSPQPATGARVALVRTTDRTSGVRHAIDLVSPEGLRGSRVYLKPNLNGTFPTPCVTHADTLRAVAAGVLDQGASHVTIAERSGVGRDTRKIAEGAGAVGVAQELGLDMLFLNEMDEQGWTKFHPPESHWQDGISVARLLLDSDAVVQTCNLKTHATGGNFTLSLKNAVGMVPYRLPGGGYHYMAELHSSLSIRSMIAEINTVYTPALVLIDGVRAFVQGGPDEGTEVEAGVLMAGTDRVALDAVGVAILRHLGTTPDVSAGPIFEQEQIRRAVELGLGASSPSEIEIVTDDAESEAYAATIRTILDQG
jgi:uncharacterized protein (DUF362 family)